MIFFTADTHFWHRAIIQHCRRPCLGLGDMHILLIAQWNDVIKPQDDVYVLGDFSFGGKAKSEEVFSLLNGKKYLIKGNHDGKHVTSLGWEWVKDYYELKVHDQDREGNQFHQPIVLCHFPFLSWNGMQHGSWHLHGHCHGSLNETHNRRLDVGVDTMPYLSPLSYDQIKRVMQHRTFTPVDHHQERV